MPGNASARMAIKPDPRGVDECVVSQPSVPNEICPFNHFDVASELSAKVLKASAPVRGGAPAVSVDLKLANDVRDHVAVEDAIFRNAYPRITEVKYLAALKAGDVFTDLVHRRVALRVFRAPGLLKFYEHHPLERILALRPETMQPIEDKQVWSRRGLLSCEDLRERNVRSEVLRECQPFVNNPEIMVSTLR